LDTVDPRVIEIALSRVGGADFENFCQGFFASTMGADYVPMGGLRDGGADGAFDDIVFEASGTQKFMQASISSTPKEKIRKTIRRLREFGRDPKSLIYATSQKLTLIDQLQDDLSDELDCRIVIRDGHYFQHQINGSPGALQAYKTYVSSAASYLNSIGSADTVQPLQDLPAKALCVFLGQELDRRRGKGELLESVADSLILWALEDTDPDQKIFLNAQEIEVRVLEALPSARTFFKAVLKNRLDDLASKGSGGRKVRYHKKENGYCLPYETREKIREENVGDEGLKLQVSEVFRNRAVSTNSLTTENAPLIEDCVTICHDVIHRSYHAQGLEMALFLESEEGSDSNLPSMNDIMNDVIADKGFVGEKAGQIAKLCLNILRGTYYDSTKEERRYLRKLSRTYVLLFMLKNEPRVVEYFRNMTSNFNLYVGADLIVRALSEQMLPKDDQMTKNALKLLKASGSKIILTDKTLDEVWHHFRSTHYEFVNNYQEIQNFMTVDLASQIDRILIRSFFYAKIERSSKRKEPFAWSNFLGQFLTVSEIGRSSTRDELREYLVNEFGFLFEDEATLLSGIDPAQLDELTSKIQAVRNNHDRKDTTEEILCRNAATMVLRVYQRRKSEGDRSGGNPYGFKTWWLTQQTRVQSATGHIVSKQGSRYMMRPEFILHFLSTLPSKKSVQDSYDSVFPTILGVKLGNRMDERAFKKIIDSARDLHDGVDDSRAKVLLAKASAQLQSDFLKQYEDSKFFAKG
jgi:hypothetical protein